MMRPRRLAAIATLGGIVFARFGMACAGSEAPDLGPDLDPSLPGLDASYDPARAEGGAHETLPEASTPTPEAGTAAENHPPPPKDSGAADVTTTAADAGPPPPSGPPKPAPGEVLITEVMYDPFGTEPDGEWFELFNTTSEARSLGGLVISDGGGRAHTIASNTTIAAGVYAVFVRSKSGALASYVPASAIAYEYGAGLPSNAGVLLANGSTGAVYLHDGGTVVAESTYGGWFSMSGGSSIQLKALNFSSETNKNSWCVSFNQWTSGSAKGTPGASEDCP